MGVRRLGWLLLLVAAGSQVPRNMAAVRVLGEQPAAIGVWYQFSIPAEVTFVPAGCHYAHFLSQYQQAMVNQASQIPRFDCPSHPLANLWAARQLWQQGQISQACELWWPMDNLLDPFQAAQFSHQAEQWPKLAQTLACLDRWREHNPTEPLINGIYGGWVATLYAGLGEYDEQAGRFEAALMSYRQAMVWEPVSDWGYGLAAGRSLVYLNRLPEALAEVNLVKNQTSEPYALLINWAEFLYAQNYVTESIPIFEAAAEAAPARTTYPCDRLQQLAHTHPACP